MLYMLLTDSGKESFQQRKTFQKEVRRALGVSAPVVSRMLRALEKLGWVTRKKAERDRRQREVSLTDKGLACIRSAHAALRGAAKRLVYRAICFGRHRDRQRRFVHMDTLESYLSSMREQWDDTATLYYRWGHPDD
jgi:DNA-binding MarR family transcriptional regulator